MPFGAPNASPFQAGVLQKVAFFTAASETFARKNTNVSISESLDRLKQVLSVTSGVFACRAYVSCAIACPFEGPIAPERVAKVVGDIWELGVEEIDLGDTIGAGTPETVSAVLSAVFTEMSSRLAKPVDCRELVTLHLHDTFGRAAECVRAALDLGVRSFDGSVAGLGGCPYASKTLPDGTIQRAPGNISTELLVQTIQDAGYRTNVDLDKLREAAAFAREIVAKSRAGGASSGGSGGSGGRPA
jgi:hydroxymethylglutaryl-CoA lyase